MCHNVFTLSRQLDFLNNSNLLTNKKLTTMEELKKLAREVATEDIQKELENEGKCFLLFIEELNPVMDSLIDEYYRLANNN